MTYFSKIHYVFIIHSIYHKLTNINTYLINSLQYNNLSHKIDTTNHTITHIAYIKVSVIQIVINEINHCTFLQEIIDNKLTLLALTLLNVTYK